MHVSAYGGGIVGPGRRSSVRAFPRVLGPKPRHVGADFRITPMPPEKLPRLGACVAEQRVVDEVDGCGGALDVQEDGADLLQVDAVRSGM
jgi:hypothetical protein